MEIMLLLPTLVQSFFNDKFVIKNVLYVPNFSFNLISISRLTTSLKCELIFSFSECLIQNFITKDKIGTIDVMAGLYVFNKGDKNILSCATKQTNIRHLRMGHPSKERLKVLQTYYPNIHIDKDFICDVCHQAKQRMLIYLIFYFKLLGFVCLTQLSFFCFS